ncbi:MAG: hypothetical protein CMJ18_07225 [Phycisphaeraceae bacterium]|nr:hypothetical protein [Phycisphaeraceae bacterium]
MVVGRTILGAFGLAAVCTCAATPGLVTAVWQSPAYVVKTYIAAAFIMPYLWIPAAYYPYARIRSGLAPPVTWRVALGGYCLGGAVVFLAIILPVFSLMIVRM